MQKYGVPQRSGLCFRPPHRFSGWERRAAFWQTINFAGGAYIDFQSIRNKRIQSAIASANASVKVLARYDQVRESICSIPGRGRWGVAAAVVDSILNSTGPGMV